ncbi:MAG: hypothetical protein J5529_07160 [Prevotella sp.]|nr:hypothetical protein [Prevotella sp.]
MIAPSNPGTDPRTSMFNNNSYSERRGKEIYKMHKIGTFFSPECAVYVNRLLNQIPGGSAWNHTYTTPYIDGYKGISKTNRNGSNYQNHFSYNLDAADNFKRKFNVNQLDKSQTYVVNMYYAGSPWDYKSRSKGNSWSEGTHTGLLVYNGNKWVVRHNFHGDIMEDPLSDLIGTKYNLGITSLSIPKNRRGGKLISKKSII